jgi:hypothetical protein
VAKVELLERVVAEPLEQELCWERLQWLRRGQTERLLVLQKCRRYRRSFGCLCPFKSFLLPAALATPGAGGATPRLRFRRKSSSVDWE